jgi:hypothetical protein
MLIRDFNCMYYGEVKVDFGGADERLFKFASLSEKLTPNTCFFVNSFSKDDYIPDVGQLVTADIRLSLFDGVPHLHVIRCV